MFFLTEGRRPSAAGKKDAGKDDKKGGKDKGGKVEPPVPEEEEVPPPPPLETQVGLRLHHWKTAMDSLKEEEEKNKPEEEPVQQTWLWCTFFGACLDHLYFVKVQCPKVNLR